MNAKRRRPGGGWTWLGSSVWEHSTGLRIHGLGAARMPDGTHVSGMSWDQYFPLARAIREQGGNRKRGLMVWGLSLLKPRP